MKPPKPEKNELDIDRMMGGQEECWSRVTKGLQRPVVRIALQLAASAGNSENTFAGIVALAYGCTMLAEVAGCTLEVMALCTGHNPKRPSTDYPRSTNEGGFIFPLKQPHEPVNLNQMLCVGIPAMCRWYEFNIQTNAIKGQNAMGMGEARPVTAALREHLNLQYVLEVAWEGQAQATFLDEFVTMLVDAK